MPINNTRSFNIRRKLCETVIIMLNSSRIYGVRFELYLMYRLIFLDSSSAGADVSQCGFMDFTDAALIELAENLDHYIFDTKGQTVAFFYWPEQKVVQS